MPRLVTMLCLIIAFSGPLLTHSEAADDLARSLVEMLDRGHIEPPDGGVGDDPIVASSWRAGPALDSVWSLTPIWVGPTTALALLPPDPGTRRRRRRVPSWPSPSTAPRQAWLQLFLC
jgi:hypothetical protein